MFKDSYIHERINSSKYDIINIWQSDKRTLIETNQGNPADLNASFENFKNGALAGSYVIELRNSAFARNAGNAKIEEKPCFLPYRLVDNAGVNGPGFNGMQNQIFELQRQLLEKEYERKLQDLQDSTSNQTLSMLKEIGMAIYRESKGQNISGPGRPDPVSAPPGGFEDEFAALFERWQSVDSDLLPVVRALVAMAENEPDQYFTYRKFLVNG